MWFFGGVTSRSIVRRSFLNAAILAVHAFTSGGASDLGQYPSGHAAETYFELRLKSRMSRWARRRCSSSIQAVCGKAATLTPASCKVQSPMASSKVMCAPPPFSKYRRWSRRDLSRRSDGLVVLEVRFLLEVFFFMIPLVLSLDRYHRRCNHCGLGRFSPVHSADPPHQTPHRQLSFGIGKKDFACAGAAIAPALQDREVLHSLNRA